MIDSETQTIFLPLGIYGAIENEACGLDVDYDSLPTKFEDYERFICRGSGSGYTSSGEFTAKEDINSFSWEPSTEWRGVGIESPFTIDFETRNDKSSNFTCLGDIHFDNDGNIVLGEK